VFSAKRGPSTNRNLCPSPFLDQRCSPFYSLPARCGALERPIVGAQPGLILYTSGTLSPRQRLSPYRWPITVFTIVCCNWFSHITCFLCLPEPTLVAVALCCHLQTCECFQPIVTFCQHLLPWIGFNDDTQSLSHSSRQ